MMCRKLEIGFLPRALSIDSERFSVRDIPDFQKILSLLEKDDGYENGWIFAPLQTTVDIFTGIERAHPFNSRVFGLPKSHIFVHKKSDHIDESKFYLWVLSFLFGVRLTETEAGFLDATPLKTGRLVDFHVHEKSIDKIVHLAEKFWVENRRDKRKALLLGSAIHAMFMAKCPTRLQFERFIFVYAALDACYALVSILFDGRKSTNHAARVAWMCEKFRLSPPAWAIEKKGKSEISVIRNMALHEGVFVDNPLGFSIYVHKPGIDIVQEMCALVCRLLISIIGGADSEYAKSPCDSCQYELLKL